MNINYNFAVEIKKLKQIIIQERLLAKANFNIREGWGSEIDIVAQESVSFEDFVKNVKAHPDFKMADIFDAEVKEFLQGVWNSAEEDGVAGRNVPSGTNETIKIKDLKRIIREEIKKQSSGFASGKEFINIKLQKYPKALTKVNELITMIGESKFTMEMAEWLFEFFNNASFERPVSESKRVS